MSVSQRMSYALDAFETECHSTSCGRSLGISVQGVLPAAVPPVEVASVLGHADSLAERQSSLNASRPVMAADCVLFFA